MRSSKIKGKFKGSAKINTLSEECVNLHGHNHEINVYKSQLYMLKNKCKVESRQFRETLSLIFWDTTQNQPTSTEFSYKNIESSMYVLDTKLNPRFQQMH